MLPNPAIRKVTIKDYLKIIRKHLTLVIALLVIIPAIVAIYVVTKKPIYRSTVSLLIEFGNISTTQLNDAVEPVSSQGSMPTQYYKTQYKILSSYILAEKVYEDLKLNQDPEFANLNNPVAVLQGRVGVEPVKESNVVLLHIEDSDPLRAATIANAYGKAYIQQYIDTSNHASTIRIIDSAKLPEHPLKPKKQQSILMAILFSLFFGIGVAVLLEYLDSSIRTAEDVNSYLNLPFLGYIPSISIQDGKNESEKALICCQNITNPAVESYRALRTSILFSSPEDRPLKAILVTSSLPGEGKSFIATNLASIFSQMNERVLLIDLDMRRPKLYKLFNIDQKPGLSAFLAGNASLESIIRTTQFSNLSIITSGAIPFNPSELLSSDKIRVLLEDLRSKFDRIIIDSSPALNVTDAHLLASSIDGVILVVKGASTRLEAVLGAKNKILESKGKLIGAVVNNINSVKEDRYYYHQYYYTEDKVKHKKA